MQTLLSRSMGPLERWEDLIKMQTEIGYNCFHVAPIQKLGFSQSLYALADQLEIAEYILKKDENNKEEGFKTVQKKVHELSEKYGCTFFGEVVLNHTSFDSEWINECPDACYNLKNTPQLTSGFKLDNGLLEFSRKIARGEVPQYPKNTIENEEDLGKLMGLIHSLVVQPLKLHEYFLINVEKAKADFEEYIAKNKLQSKFGEKAFASYEERNHALEYHNLSGLVWHIQSNLENLGAESHGVRIQCDKVANYFNERSTKGYVEQLETALNRLNEQLERMARGYLGDAMGSIHNTLRYHKLELKDYEVTLDKPLLHPYFTILRDGTAVANNGWLYSGDPTEDFAASNNFYYLRRGIVIWGDLVKLRFGQSKKDCPTLWKRMTTYVQQTALIFNGLRLDNAHSTPIHVAEYLVRKARKVNPNLYVFSELFTGSGEKDALFTKRIAVNALVREAIQQHTPHNLCASLHYFSQGMDAAVGSLDPYTETDSKTQKDVYILKPRIPDALFYDLTHDNESYFKKRTFMDSLSTAALLSMSNCFVATTKGFDEFFAENLSVINEKRVYGIVPNPLEGASISKEGGVVTFTFNDSTNAQSVEVRGSWDQWKESIVLEKSKFGNFRGTAKLPVGTHVYKFILDKEHWCVDHTKPISHENHVRNNTIRVDPDVKRHSNMWYVRSQLNKLHNKVATKYPEFYLDEITGDVITISRENIKKTKSYMLITRTAFSNNSDDVNVTITLPGKIDKFSIIAYADSYVNTWKTDDKVAEGMDCNVIIDSDISRYAETTYDENTKSNRLRFFRMPPGFVCMVHIILNRDQEKAIEELEQLKNIDKSRLAKELAEELTPADINYLLFSCESEESDWTHGGRSTFHLPNYGHLPYAGFGAFFRILKDARLKNDLATPLFDNLRAGNWLLDFLVNRLENKPRLGNIFNWVKKYFDYLKVIPRHLIPKYFTRVFGVLTSVILQKTYKIQNLDSNIENTRFFRRLITACYEFVADVPSGSVDDWKTTLAAGLPHFSTSWARCWGRDTFISFKGGLVIPGLYDVAKDVILMFATSLRHGLLPNLLDGGRNSRYNCRDATWFFVKAIKDYTEFTNDFSILKEKVPIRALSDDKDENEQKKKSGEVKTLTLAQVIQEIFQRHAQGIKFREWNAGYQIDEKMTHEGFNIELTLDEETGFIYGGNPNNCLTWMDKMGSSEKAGIKGVPGSSRDGAPIEMTALLKSGLDFVIAANQKGHFEHTGVKTQKGSTLLFTEWATKIQNNFEKHYWIPEDTAEFKDYKLNPEAVRRRGIYKDTIGSVGERQDYYFRPNGCVAMHVAPTLFKKENAVKYLENVEAFLIEEHSLGLKTLDPEADHYIPWYDNANDSHDSKVAQGFSYHNGPEWVWIYGSFLIASLHFRLKEKNMTVFMSYLTNHKAHIENNDWMSLPEMTNGNGGYCQFSCPAQTWSIATIVEAIYEAQKTFKLTK